tara:strand:+ start:2909 stop:3085 length:177 start_codon:yes stop_codon:yes gene_type:complete
MTCRVEDVQFAHRVCEDSCELWSVPSGVGRCLVALGWNEIVVMIGFQAILEFFPLCKI